jgi:hypothetical protein
VQCERSSTNHRQEFTLVHKVWLLDYADKHPGVNAADLDKAPADHINGQRANAEQMLVIGNIRRGLAAETTGKDKAGQLAVSVWC